MSIAYNKPNKDSPLVLLPAILIFRELLSDCVPKLLKEILFPNVIVYFSHDLT